MSIILNKEELLESNSELRRVALEILEAGLEAINTEKILRKKLRVENGTLVISAPPLWGGGGVIYNLKSFERIFFIGIGKCALDGARVIEEILGDYLTTGAVIDVKSSSEASGLKKIKYFEGTHPYPSEQNVSATKEILEMVKGLTQNDLIITLISGGGSSLFELPAPGFDLNQIIEKTKELTLNGADIYELNKARKEMSQVKGGKFAEICHPAPMVSLIFSDVLGNDLSTIASGPTVLDTPSEDVKNILIVSNDDALQAMKSKAVDLGFDTIIETEKLSGNATEVGKELAGRELKPKTCVLFGGETTVIIKDPNPMGGRSQEMALAALPFIKEGSLLVCTASDGWDNTDHAGAIADSALFEKSKSMNLSSEEYLEKSNGYNFFQKAGGAIYTGKLGSNVSDLCILIYK